jgi:hypothetical protein
MRELNQGLVPSTETGAERANDTADGLDDYARAQVAWDVPTLSKTWARWERAENTQSSLQRSIGRISGSAMGLGLIDDNNRALKAVFAGVMASEVAFGLYKMARGVALARLAWERRAAVAATAANLGAGPPGWARIAVAAGAATVAAVGINMATSYVMDMNNPQDRREAKAIIGGA